MMGFLQFATSTMTPRKAGEGVEQFRCPAFRGKPPQVFQGLLMVKPMHASASDGAKAFGWPAGGGR